MESSRTPHLGRHSEEQGLQKKVMKSALKGTSHSAETETPEVLDFARPAEWMDAALNFRGPVPVTDIHSADAPVWTDATLWGEHSGMGSIHRDTRVWPGQGVESEEGNSTLHTGEPRGGKRPLRGGFVPPYFAKQMQTMTSPATNRENRERSAAVVCRPRARQPSRWGAKTLGAPGVVR